MKKNISLFSLFLFLQFSIAQTTTTNYWVLFKDKKNSPYSIKAPAAFLSQKAIERRVKQNIRITENDLPVNPAYLSAVKITGVQIVSVSKWFNALSVSTSDPSKIQAIKEMPFVKEITPISISPQPDHKLETESKPLKKSEELLNDRSSNVFNYGPSLKQATQIGVDCLHNKGYQGQGMTIASLDDGFYKADSLPAFDTLRTNGQILGTHDFVDTSSVYTDANDAHGMNTLSCIG